MEQEIRFCTSADGTRIAYATFGEPAARALVSLPSFESVQELAWNYLRIRCACTRYGGESRRPALRDYACM